MHFVLWNEIIIQMLKMTKIHLSHWIICVNVYIRKFWHFMVQQKSKNFAIKSQPCQNIVIQMRNEHVAIVFFPTSLKWLEYYDSAKLLIYFIYHQMSTFVELYVTWQIIIIFRKKVYESIIIRIYLLYFILFCSVLIRFLISISILSPWENT